MSRPESLTGHSRSPLPEGTRPWLAAGTALSSLAFGWAAWVLPSRPETPLALLLWALCVLHACTALSVALRPQRSQRPLRLLAVASLVAAPVFVFAISTTSVQMVQTYGPLGWALSVALGAIAWLLLLGTLPVGVFGLYATRAAHERS